MPLNNDGDEILLIDADSVPVSRAAYNAAQVQSGEWIEFGRSRWQEKDGGYLVNEV